MNNSATRIPTQENLIEVFEKIKNATYDGVPGVIRFASGKPGPVLGITIQTHGNEPSGLAALWYFLNISPVQKLLQKGTVFFVLNNIHATEKYFDSNTDEEKRAARFINTNFNRLPKDVMSQKETMDYEVNRAQELLGIWSKFDVGLDIHSTAQDSKPMIIVINKFEKELIIGFPIEIVISNIENIQIGKPATAFYGGNRNIPVFGIEAGPHEEPESFETAIACTKSLLQNLGMISKDKEVSSKREYQLYEIVGSVMFPNSSYSLDHVFPMLGQITKGDIVANGDGGAIYAPTSGCTIFGPKQVIPDSIAEEVLFFTNSPVKLSV